MLSPDERAEFARSGLLRLPAAIAAATAAAMLDRCWQCLSDRHGIVRDRPDTWPHQALAPAQGAGQRPPHLLRALRRTGAFDPMATDRVRAALDDLLGADAWRSPRAWGLPLVTFPTPGTWTVPSAAWHVDSHGPEHDLPGVTVFTFLAPVAAGGGGTVVLAGSHRVFNRHIAATGQWRSAEVKAALAAANPWLRGLWSAGKDPGRVARYVEEGAAVDDTHLRVRELTGAPGDVFLMHSRTLHAPAPNHLTTPRMMVVEIIGRAG